MSRFRVRLYGCFSCFDLYDGKGREIFNMEIACRVAENNFGTDWREVYNGEEGCTREEWVAASDLAS